MHRNIFADVVVRDEIEQSQSRIDRSRSIMAASKVSIDSSMNAVRASRDLIQSRPIRTIDALSSSSASHLLDAMDGSAIEQVVADLTRGYAEARDTGDEAGEETFRKALVYIGRHIGARLGPKAAGVVMN